MTMLVASSGALDRLRVGLDIFTDSSCACGARNAKGCVCTGLLPGEGHRYDRKSRGNFKNGRSKQRPYQFRTEVKSKGCPPKKQKQAAATQSK